ncbi:hypothetical protein, partial [Pantoea dispersa]|uniref:hypothetical protein n=1 Tax=Pantoea dispersa TaxID=59814 RepID=UPI001C65902B
MGIRKSGFLGSWIAVAASGRAMPLLRIPNPESPIPAFDESPFPIPYSLFPAVKRLSRLEQDPARGDELVAA